MSDRRFIVENEKFEGRGDDAALPLKFSDMTVRSCTFFACQFGMTAKLPSDRKSIAHVDLIACTAKNNSWLGPVTVEDVGIDSLRTGGLCITWGTAFRHVTFKGRCGKFLLNLLPSGGSSPERLAAFAAANLEFYRATDWALDISKGEFEEMDIRTVPADLIRRDPDTQVVVRRSRVEETQSVWRKLDLSGTPWAISLATMLQLGLNDKVLVAAKRRPDFARWLAGLRLLQREGVAETD